MLLLIGRLLVQPFEGIPAILGRGRWVGVSEIAEFESVVEIEVVQFSSTLEPIFEYSIPNYCTNFDCNLRTVVRTDLPTSPSCFLSSCT